MGWDQAQAAFRSFFIWQKISKCQRQTLIECFRTGPTINAGRLGLTMSSGDLGNGFYMQ
jgi:hypothetical protein